MSKMIFNSKKKKLVVGDLVYHLLYGRDWLAILLKLIAESEESTLAIVHMVPGTRYERHFEKALTKYHINDSMGYITEHWLRKIAIGDKKKS
jgi:hypothetical protein